FAPIRIRFERVIVLWFEGFPTVTLFVAGRLALYPGPKAQVTIQRLSATPTLAITQHPLDEDRCFAYALCCVPGELDGHYVLRRENAKGCFGVYLILADHGRFVAR